MENTSNRKRGYRFRFHQRGCSGGRDLTRPTSRASRTRYRFKLHWRRTTSDPSILTFVRRLALNEMRCQIERCQNRITAANVVIPVECRPLLTNVEDDLHHVLRSGRKMWAVRSRDPLPALDRLVSTFFAAVDVDIRVAESFLRSGAVGEVRRRGLIARRRLRQFFTVGLARERGSLRFVAAK